MRYFIAMLAAMIATIAQGSDRCDPPYPSYHITVENETDYVSKSFVRQSQYGQRFLNMLDEAQQKDEALPRLQNALGLLPINPPIKSINSAIISILERQIDENNAYIQDVRGMRSRAAWLVQSLEFNLVYASAYGRPDNMNRVMDDAVRIVIFEGKDLRTDCRYYFLWADEYGVTHVTTSFPREEDLYR
jgi:hypothetical protein